MYRVSQKKVSLVDCWSYQSFVTFKKVSLTHSISSDGLENFFIYPTWVKENCKKFSDQNTVWNMVKIHFEKYKKVEKIQNFMIENIKVSIGRSADISNYTGSIYATSPYGWKCKRPQRRKQSTFESNLPSKERTK